MKKKMSKVITITSGKGGVGKTLTTVNLAIAAQRLGHKVLVLDGDMGMANVDVVLGLQARYNISNVIEEKISLGDIILDGPLGIRVIPSGSGISKLTQLSYVQRVRLIEQIEALDEEFDVLMIDTGAGISDTVIQLNSVADEKVIVTTPEPHAITDAYAMMKVLNENDSGNHVNLLVNMVKSEAEGLKVFKRLAEVARRFLEIDIEYLGCVPTDPQVQKSIACRQAASEHTTHTIAGQAWNQITREIFGYGRVSKRRDNQEIWRELIWAQQAQAGVRI